MRGAGFDVFAKEPCTDSPLFDLPQVVVTPHLGASTAEAQDRAGTDVAASVRLALAGEFVPDAVNVGGGAVSEEVAPWLDLVRKLGLLVAALSPELPASVSVQVRGELASEEVGVLRLSALRGLFSAVIEDQVTFVNAPALAAERGVEASISTASESPNHRSVVDVRAVTADGSVVNVAGTVVGPLEIHKIVQINGRNFDMRAEGVNLIINYVDRPGVLGKIGTLLGAANVNIHAAQLSEDAEGPGATILLRLDQDVPRELAVGHRRRDRGEQARSRGLVVKLAVIAGDGIGPEVIGEAVKVLDAVLPGVDKTDYDLGARRYHATGEVLPESVLDELRGHDAILLGAIGDPVGTQRRARTRAAAEDPLRAGSPHQPAARPAVSRCRKPVGRQSAHRLRRRPRGHGRPVHRHRRCDPGRHSSRGGHRGEHQHRLRRPQGGAGCVRPGRTPS